MKIKVYKVYLGNDLDKIFLIRKRALDYKENLEIYNFDKDLKISIEMGYIYV